MSERPEEPLSDEPTATEMDEMLADLDFFLNLDQADALPLDESVAQTDAEDDHE